MPTVTKTLQQVADQVTATTVEVVGTAVTLVNGFVGSNPVAQTVSKTVIDLTDYARQAGEGMVRTIVGRPAAAPAPVVKPAPAKSAAKRVPVKRVPLTRVAVKPAAKRVPVKRTAKATSK